MLWQVGLSEGPAGVTRGPEVRSPVLAKVSLEGAQRLPETGTARSGAWAFSDSGPFFWGHTLVQGALLRASGSQEASLGQEHPLLLRVGAARDQWCPKLPSLPGGDRKEPLGYRGAFERRVSVVLPTEATGLPCLVTAQQAGLTPDPLGHPSLTVPPFQGHLGSLLLDLGCWRRGDPR